jgi:hypothetical protein
VAWITKQPRLTQIYAVVVAQLNDVGILPGGAEIKPWIRQEIADHEITADQKEIATVLSGLIAEKAITQSDVNTLMRRNHAKSIPGTR